MTEKMMEQSRDEDYRSPFGQETAPSDVRQDEPTVARFFGMAGLLLVFAAASIIMLNTWVGPRWLTPPWGYTFLIFGLAALLFHAARETETQLRRSYGFLGFGLVAVAIGLAVMPQQDAAMGVLFLPWGAIAGLLGLFFLMPFAHNETDPFYRTLSIRVLGGVGAAAALVGFVGGNASADFLVSPGVVYIIFGLLYLWATIGLLGTNSERGYRLALAVGALGALAFLAALARSLAPMLSSSVSRYFLPSGLLLMASGAIYALFALALVSDNRLIALTRRELASYFYSPIAYIVLLGFTAIGWWTYFQFSGELYLRSEQGASLQEPIVRNFFIDFFPVMSAIFVVPVVTMKLLSEERRSGTLEVLLTAPVGELTVVLSKFFAGLIYYLFLWIPWGLFLVALRVEGGREFDYRPLLSFAVVLVATGAAFIAMGVFFSALTRNQIIAAVLTFVGMMLLLGFYFIQSRVSPQWQTVLSQIGFVDLWIESLSGKLFLRSVIAQLSIAVFWLFLAVKALEARKWT
jgi:ABC-type transport system involved in multi-copper enzyme maturation permease subunit